MVDLSSKMSPSSGLGKLRLYNLQDWRKKRGFRHFSLPTRKRKPGFYSNLETILDFLFVCLVGFAYGFSAKTLLKHPFSGLPQFLIVGAASRKG